MPHCWHHTTSLSTDGYANPDNGAFTFIGFSGAAPFLTYDGLGVSDAGYYFVRYFYIAALLHGKSYSINMALDYAAQQVWGVNFVNCVMRNGYNIGGYTGQMKVYGNGNMHISEYESGGGGGGCPLLYVFDGLEYRYEDLLNIHNQLEMTL